MFTYRRNGELFKVEDGQTYIWRGSWWEETEAETTEEWRERISNELRAVLRECTERRVL